MSIPSISPYGDQALLVAFEPKIRKKINRQVHALAQVSKNLKGVIACVPAYNSLLIHYLPTKTSFKKLKQQLIKKLPELALVKQQGTLHRIPVCYHNDFGPDWDFVLTHTGLDKKEIIRRHTSKKYHVFMMGFLPGFAYLGKLPSALQCPRKNIPSQQVAKGAVGLAGWQTGIYPSASPGGWQIIGQTPISLHQPEHTPSCLLQAGDVVQFYEISKEVFEGLAKSRG